MIYLNNAGTSWPKPKEMVQAINTCIDASPSDWLTFFDEGIATVASFLSISDLDRLSFTQSCTQALSIAFSDFPWGKGDRLIISSMEHHALSRWFFKLQNERSIEGVIIPRSKEGPFDLEVFENELKKGATMVAITMASNVTGEILPYQEILALSKKYKSLCLLDGAQVAGIIPINITELDPDIFVFAGHKGTLAPHGVGGLYISNNISMRCPSAVCEINSSGKASAFPSYCDLGSAPIQAIAGLTAGVNWLNDQGWGHLLQDRNRLVDQLRSGLKSIQGLEIVGSNNWQNYTGAVSITSSFISLKQINELLHNKYKVIANYGFQCSPLAHTALATDVTGTLRFSLGSFSTLEEVNFLLNALNEIVNK